MLVLTRRDGEAIVITTPAGERITVTILSASRDKVRVGVEAPRAVIVDRGEVDVVKRGERT